MLPLSIICLPISLFLVHVLSFSLFIIALSFPLSGDRFWLRQTCKGPDLDTVRHPRISGPRDYSQQGEPPLFPSVSCELSAVCPFKTRHSAFEQTIVSTCCRKWKHITLAVISEIMFQNLKRYSLAHQPEDMVLGMLMSVSWICQTTLGMWV